MSIVSHIVVFTISWWLILFMVLPIGVRTVEEEGGPIEPGIVGSAPVKPMIIRKMAATTVLAALVWLMFFLADKYDWVTASDFYS